MTDGIKTNVAFKWGNNLALSAPVVNASLINARFLTVTGTIWRQTIYANASPVYINYPANASYIACFVDDSVNPQTCTFAYAATVGAAFSGFTITAQFNQVQPYVSPLTQGIVGTITGTMAITQSVTGTTQVQIIFWGG